MHEPSQSSTPPNSLYAIHAACNVTPVFLQFTQMSNTYTFANAIGVGGVHFVHGTAKVDMKKCTKWTKKYIFFKFSTNFTFWA